MHKNASYSDRAGESSLGILNIDDLRAFGEISASCSMPKHSSRINDRVNMERASIFANRFAGSINLTDLVSDKTINLDNLSTNGYFNSKESKISFDAAEITGRSTLYGKENGSPSGITVNEILATSFAPQTRNLCETLRESNVSLNSMGSSSFSASRSLPRTADLSIAKSSSVRESLNSDCAFGGFFRSADDSALSSECFAPAELMESKLLQDEIAWSHDYAAIPKQALDDEARASSNASIDFSTKNSLATNFSMGEFFNMRSNDICDLMKHSSRSLTKYRDPVALLDERDCTTTSNSEVDTSLTPKGDNRHYTKLRGNKRDAQTEHHDSKDSGNHTNTSMALSMSAIDRALRAIQMGDNCEATFNNMPKSKKTQSNANLTDADKKENQEELKSLQRSFDCGNKKRKQHQEEFESLSQLILENKENVDPLLVTNKNLSDTVSFTESLLNSSEMRRARDKSTLSRSPLSPIQFDCPDIKLTEPESAVEADDDEWPSTPVVAEHRRVRRKKTSPKHQQQENETTLENEPQLPAPEKHNSLSSTRLDYGENSKASPKPAKLIAQTLDINNFRADSPISPVSFTHSPMASPRSGLSPRISSPTGGYISPRLDSTTNSERRYLNAGSAVSRTASSPASSESAIKYGVPPSRVGSSASLRSGMSGQVGRSISRCSYSSEFSHHEGKAIPLKVTAVELSWGSTRLRKDVHKAMQVKNTANKRLVVRVEVHGPGFQIVNAHGNTLTLQPQECRTIAINFCPTVIGAAIGMLSFYSPQGTSAGAVPFLNIPLYAYGGHATINTIGILQGPVGSAFLSMGDVHDISLPLERTFKIHNKGALQGFAFVCIDSLGLNMPRLCDSFEVRPSKMLIAPGQVTTISVTFRPRREDIKKIFKSTSNVLTLSHMRIVCGDEANRQRLRSLVQRMAPGDRYKITSSSIDQLLTTFPNETEIFELAAIKEKPDVAYDLLALCRIHEVALTLNHDTMEESFDSSTLYLPDADETVLFRTVCGPSPSSTPTPQLDPVDEQLEHTNAANDEGDDAVSSTHEPVSPKLIEFSVDGQKRTVQTKLCIRNHFKSRQYFEIICSHKGLLDFDPTDGFLPADGGQVEVAVQASLRQLANVLDKEQVTLMVHMENESYRLPVKLLQKDST